MVFRRAMALRPVQSLKHVIDTNGAITGGTPSTTDVITTVDSPVLASVNQCANGSTVSSLFLNISVVPVIAAGGVNNMYLIVYKNPANNLSAPPVDSVGTSDRKRYVVHQEMLMLGNGVDQGSNISRTLFKGVIKLPRTFKRNGYEDRLQVIIGHRAGEVTQQSDFCLQCIYKEFR